MSALAPALPLDEAQREVRIRRWLRPRLSVLALLVMSVLSVGFSWGVGEEVARGEPQGRWLERVDQHLRVVAQAELLDAAGLAGTDLERAALIRDLGRARTAMAGDPTEARRLLEALYLDSPGTDVEARAIELMIELAAPGWPEGYRGEFLAGLAPAAIESGRARKIPPSVTLAQAIIESGWGRSQLTRKHHNLFGVKGGSGASKVMVRARVSGSGRSARYARLGYRSYPSFAASIAHHGELLSQSSAYAKARPLWRDWRAYLKCIGPIYARDPRYVRAVSDMITRYDLDQWDRLVVLAVERDAIKDES